MRSPGSCVRIAFVIQLLISFCFIKTTAGHVFDGTSSLILEGNQDFQLEREQTRQDTNYGMNSQAFKIICGWETTNNIQIIDTLKEQLIQEYTLSETLMFRFLNSHKNGFKNVTNKSGMQLKPDSAFIDSTEREAFKRYLYEYFIKNTHHTYLYIWSNLMGIHDELAEFISDESKNIKSREVTKPALGIQNMVQIYPEIERMLLPPLRRAEVTFHFCPTSEINQIGKGESGILTFYFDKNKSDLDFKFVLNKTEQSQKKVISIVDSTKNDLIIKDITINSWASPEGPENINIDLAKKRAFAVQKYIVQQIRKSFMDKNNNNPKKPGIDSCFNEYIKRIAFKINYDIDWNGFLKTVQSGNLKELDEAYKFINAGSQTGSRNRWDDIVEKFSQLFNPVFSKVTIKINPDNNCALFINEVLQNTTTEPFIVPKGRHTLRVSKTGYSPATRQILVNNGKDQRIYINLSKKH